MSSFIPDLKNNPTSVGVYPRTLESFLEIVGSVDVVLTKGRCIHVRRKSGLFPSFGELAVDLLGFNNPCDEFYVKGLDLYARLKTVAQVCADNSAGVTDDVFGEFGVKEAANGISTQGFSQFVGTTNAEQAPTRGKGGGRKKNKVPEGAATTVMKAMKLAAPHGAIETEKLIAESVKLMPARKDTRGQDRRKDYAARAIEKLVELELLFVHGAEQHQVSLSTLVTGDE